ncbi:FecR family protein [Pseudomonas sp. MPFS]|uniref:FecR family protein n=1 Tax=Pseudomonas sp. MPFS TaxID=2795724 RepID=UPI001F12EB4C|nr:FecR family protein [Pseudomonas sp. MPFS]UMZ14262.1 FecR family protein [Pseudomonas sp. MPFS]
MSRQRLDPEIEQAIEWMVRLRAGDADPRLEQELAAWLASDPAHAQAWQQLQAKLGTSFNTLRTLDQRLPGQAGEARQLLLSPHASRRQLLRGLVGLGLLGSGLWLGARTPYGETLLADLSTGRGQRRDFTLADGSRLSLDADSAVDLSFDDQQRLLVLRHGQLLIQVASDSRRPLRVQTLQGQVQALGTRFLVSQETDASRIVVQEHSVRLRLRTGHEQDLQQGQAALLHPGRIELLAQDQAYRGDWLNGRLSVLDDSLEQVIAALRPYCRGYIRVSPAISQLRVQGVFPLDEPERALDALAQTLPIRIERYGPWFTVIQPHS